MIDWTLIRMQESSSGRPELSAQVESEFPDQWALVQRVSSGTALKNAPRLRELFEYLCQCALTAPGTSVSEHQIGTAVFGRAPGYNTSQDTIVRTQISHLRKRLQQHFLSDGSVEPVSIEIPVGSYLPVFQPRKEPAAPLPPVRPPVPPRSRTAIAGYASLVAVLALACAGLLWQNIRLQRERPAVSPAAPYVSHLWRQCFGNGRQTYFVTSDADALFLTNFTNRPVTLSEYRAQGYPRNLLDRVPGTDVRLAIGNLMDMFLTTSQDGIVTARLTQTADRYGLATGVVYARDLRIELQAGNNLVLLGHRKANPWVELFEERTNFFYDWDAEKKKGLVRNRNPRPGEQQIYPAGSMTYATVSYLPFPAGGGSVVMLGGSDMTAVDTGARFLCDEASVRKLHETLGVKLNENLPYFEVLLGARRVLDVPYAPEMIASRNLGPVRK